MILPMVLPVYRWYSTIQKCTTLIGTREAFELAKRHFSDLANRNEEVLISQHRALFLYALLACKMGELGGDVRTYYVSVDRDVDIYNFLLFI